MAVTWLTILAMTLQALTALILAVLLFIMARRKGVSCD